MNSDAYKANNKPEKGGQPGIYKHPLTNAELTASNFPHADAFLRQGWEWDRELPRSEQPIESAGLQPNAFAEIADLKARLAVAENAAALSKTQAEQNQKAETEENKKAAEDTLSREAARKEQEEARTKSDAKVSEAKEQLKESK